MIVVTVNFLSPKQWKENEILEKNVIVSALRRTHIPFERYNLNILLKISRPYLKFLSSGRWQVAGRKYSFGLLLVFYITEIPVTPPSCEYHVINHYLLINGRNFPRFVFIFNFRQKKVLFWSLEPTLRNRRHGDVPRRPTRRPKSSEKHAF